MIVNFLLVFCKFFKIIFVLVKDIKEVSKVNGITPNKTCKIHYIVSVFISYIICSKYSTHCGEF